ncbi:hypothetical protein TREMEDRAFT_66492 [Tremella mesenterica DSM 1558]|uniref:uncharacterized protein n=1 Tax=Tremella mesenterica (strain ATCC 24925 / CBS 8224 / DSM 1558 / NBRC 9311 / NRRL Y-6157 / RJB 2259-6 / UBC 559-6) TaxID=578456 RepID=UPI00032C7B69|nr:uncharacterized protein TREMEDRAFT_66492 [Tremella mesenterica DSM 1558]EIW65500.1 hypothetical protein TREMEDRAFT_66492 [Tremella mesenterica DSM 1558]
MTKNLNNMKTKTIPRRAPFQVRFRPVSSTRPNVTIPKHKSETKFVPSPSPSRHMGTYTPSHHHTLTPYSDHYHMDTSTPTHLTPTHHPRPATPYPHYMGTSTPSHRPATPYPHHTLTLTQKSSFLPSPLMRHLAQSANDKLEQGYGESALESKLADLTRRVEALERNVERS